jgi:hypothetical protein
MTGSSGGAAGGERVLGGQPAEDAQGGGGDGLPVGQGAGRAVYGIVPDTDAFLRTVPGPTPRVEVAVPGRAARSASRRARRSRSSRSSASSAASESLTSASFSVGSAIRRCPAAPGRPRRCGRTPTCSRCRWRRPAANCRRPRPRPCARREPAGRRRCRQAAGERCPRAPSRRPQAAAPPAVTAPERARPRRRRPRFRDRAAPPRRTGSPRRPADPRPPKPPPRLLVRCRGRRRGRASNRHNGGPTMAVRSVVRVGGGAGGRSASRRNAAMAPVSWARQVTATAREGLGTGLRSGDVLVDRADGELHHGHDVDLDRRPGDQLLDVVEARLDASSGTLPRLFRLSGASLLVATCCLVPPGDGLRRPGAGPGKCRFGAGPSRR